MKCLAGFLYYVSNLTSPALIAV